MSFPLAQTEKLSHSLK